MIGATATIDARVTGIFVILALAALVPSASLFSQKGTEAAVHAAHCIIVALMPVQSDHASILQDWHRAPHWRNCQIVALLASYRPKILYLIILETKMVARRIAVLVDGDNVSPNHSTRVISEATKLGRVDVARVYAAANRPSDWLVAPGYRLMHAGAGKNAADLLLSIDAMELALVGGLETFVIATSDGDFSHLAQRLRERGMHVLGLGEEKAPMGFRLACTEFALLPTLKKPANVAATPVAGNGSELDRNIRSMIALHSQKGRGMRIADLGRLMHTTHGTQMSTYPEGNWRTYLSKRPTLYQIDPRGPEAMARYLP